MRIEMINDENEQNCWHNFIAGSEEAFRELYTNYVDRLFSFGCGFCVDEDIVKDAIQDMFIDLYKYRAGLDTNVNLSAYLYSSFRRKLLLNLKKKRQLEPIDGQFLPDFSMDWDAETNMMREEQEKELTHLLTQEIKKLSGRQREVLYLRFTLEMTYEEVAGVMQVSVATSRTLVYRAVKQLRVNMEDIKVPILNLLLLVFTD